MKDENPLSTKRIEMLGADVFRPLVSDTCIQRRYTAMALVAVPIFVGVFRPDVASNPVFLAGIVAVCAQALVIAVPRVLWLQFEREVHWEDICHDRDAQKCFLLLSNLVVVAGLAICVTVLVGRYHAGDLLQMATVAEIGSTLFLVRQAQATLGRPALAYGRFVSRRKEERLVSDLIERPRLMAPGFLPNGSPMPVSLSV